MICSVLKSVQNNLETLESEFMTKRVKILNVLKSVTHVMHAFSENKKKFYLSFVAFFRFCSDFKPLNRIFNTS